MFLGGQGSNQTVYNTGKSKTWKHRENYINATQEIRHIPQISLHVMQKQHAQHESHTEIAVMYQPNYQNTPNQ